MDTVAPKRDLKGDFPLSGPAMETAYEPRRRGLAAGNGEEIAALIDEHTGLPEQLFTLMALFGSARFEPDAVAFRKYVLDQTGAALQRAGFEFTYFEDDTATLTAARNRLREGR